MRIRTIAATACLAMAIGAPVIAAESGFAVTALAEQTARSENGVQDWWSRDNAIADKDGRCAAITLDQAKKNGYNCWLIAVIQEKAAFFIRVNDWNRQSGGLFISRDGRKHYPVIEVWVRGYHGNDNSVAYRWSSSLYRFECGRGVIRFSRDQFLTYDANDTLIDEIIQKRAMRIAIPGSKEEQLAFAAC